MTSPTAYKVLAPLAALMVAFAGAAIIDKLPAPTTALTQAVHTTDSEATAPDQTPVRSSQASLTRVDGAVHQVGAITQAQNAEVLAYWTDERMATARPISDLIDSTLDLTGSSLFPAPEDQEVEWQVSRPDSAGERWTNGGLVTRTTGKVYLTLDGRDFTCSASVVDSANRSTLVTAGHCAKDGRGSWARNWTFVPGHSAGGSPHGKFTARDLLVAPQWADQADDSYDFAMVVLNKDGSETVQDRVGSQPISFDSWSQAQVERGVQVYSFGYPASSPYDGEDLHYCSGRTTPDAGGTTANGMRCAMTQGSSGGPWFTDFDSTTGQGTISSVVSFKYADDRNTQYGPRFGVEAQRLFERAERL